MNKWSTLGGYYKNLKFDGQFIQNQNSYNITSIGMLQFIGVKMGHD